MVCIQISKLSSKRNYLDGGEHWKNKSKDSAKINDFHILFINIYYNCIYSNFTLVPIAYRIK